MKKAELFQQSQVNQEKTNQKFKVFRTHKVVWLRKYKRHYDMSHISFTVAKHYLAT